jgi:predicted RNA binding protein YcfA (HicA-like mRNA interferase family)
MTKVPSLNYHEVVGALKRAGWSEIRQRGSHIRLERRFGEELLRITVPAHKPVKRSTLSHIIKQARMTVEEFVSWLS